MVLCLRCSLTANEQSGAGASAGTSVALHGLNDASAASSSAAPVSLYQAIKGVNNGATSDDGPEQPDATGGVDADDDVMVWDPRNSRVSFKVKKVKTPRGVSLYGESGTDPDPAPFNRMSVLADFGDAFHEEEDDEVPDAVDRGDLSASMFSPGARKNAARPSSRAFSDKVGKLTKKTLGVTSPSMLNTTSL